MKFVVYLIERMFVIGEEQVWQVQCICHEFTRAQEELRKLGVPSAYKRIRSSEVIDLEQ